MASNLFDAVAPAEAPYRRPFGGEKPSEPGFDWRSLAASAAGLGGLAAIIGSARFGGAQARLYRDWVKSIAREGAPAVEAPAGEWVPRLLRGAWWHGTPNVEDVLNEGFKLSREKMGLRFGEPAGISLSASPNIAQVFTPRPEVIRAWPRVDPKSVLPVWSEEAADPLLKAYLTAMEHQHSGQSIRDILSSLNTGGWGLKYAVGELPARYPDAARAFNQRLGQELEKQGIQGLLYNPKRYNEMEMRVFDPKRVVPIESRVSVENPHSMWSEPDAYDQFRRTRDSLARFSGVKQKRVIQPYEAQAGRSEYKSLSDFYSKLPEERVLGQAQASMKPPSPLFLEQKAKAAAAHGPAMDQAASTAHLPGNITIAETVQDVLAKGIDPHATSSKFWITVSDKLKNKGLHDLANAVNDMSTLALNNTYGSLFKSTAAPTSNLYPAAAQHLSNQAAFQIAAKKLGPLPIGNLPETLHKKLMWWDDMTAALEQAGQTGLANEAAKIAHGIWEKYKEIATP